MIYHNHCLWVYMKGFAYINSVHVVTQWGTFYKLQFTTTSRYRKVTELDPGGFIWTETHLNRGHLNRDCSFLSSFISLWLLFLFCLRQGLTDQNSLEDQAGFKLRVTYSCLLGAGIKKHRAPPHLAAQLFQTQSAKHSLYHSHPAKAWRT